MLLIRITKVGRDKKDVMCYEIPWITVILLLTVIAALIVWIR